jgi:multisite-specific tRNA:(cytosine-C5)-methyltransferase
MRYPNGLAWQLNVPKKALRRSPEFKKFHSFLVFETEVVRLTSPTSSRILDSFS